MPPLDLLGHALGTPWGPLGRLGIVLGRLGAVLGCRGAVLSRLGHLGALWCRLGTFWDRLGAVLGVFHPSRGSCPWPSLGTSKTHGNDDSYTL